MALRRAFSQGHRLLHCHSPPPIRHTSLPFPLAGAADRLRLDFLSPPRPPPPHQSKEIPLTTTRLSSDLLVRLKTEATSGRDVIVVLHLDEMVKAIEDSSKTSATAPEEAAAELRQMEKEKVEIDRKAEAGVRRELWLGLGFFSIQTLGFMRLTFWELSWDVMEPLCFFVTSLYFIAGYAFFLRTSRDPSFQGFFDSRLEAKRRRLIAAQKFDVDKFHQLSASTASMNFCHCCHKRSTLLCSTNLSVFGDIHDNYKITLT